jgi:transcriptional regulator with XRE-family HTH domain
MEKTVLISGKSDKAYLQELGEFIRAERIKQNKSQEDLALHAGVSRKSISQFESGKVSISLLTFIQILRSLNLLNKLTGFKSINPISPILMAKAMPKERIRVRKSTKKINKKAKLKSDW